MKKLLILIMLLIVCSSIFAQNNWMYIPNKSFEFNNSSTPLSNDFLFGFNYSDFESANKCGISPSVFNPSYIHSFVKEINAYSPDNVSYATVLGEQCIQFKAEKIPYNPYSNNCNHPDLTRPWVSGMIYSKVEYHYGKFEIRCRLPKGRGFWPAFWLWDGDGEIDILELANETDNVVNHPQFNYHPPGYCPNGLMAGGSNVEVTVPNFDLSDGFHIHSIEWNASHIHWKIDGKLYWTLSADKSTFFPNAPLRLIANLAVSSGSNPSSFPGPPNPNLSLGYMDIDYIRYYTEDCASKVICDETTLPSSKIEGYEVELAIPEDANLDGINDFTWTCNEPVGHYFHCSKTVANMEKLEIEAEYAVIMYPGFTAEYGSEFTAEIGPCNENINKESVNTLLLDIPKEDLEFVVYPNPNKGSFYIENKKNNELIGEYDISIVNLLGQEVYNEKMIQISKIEINLSNLFKGVYIVSIFSKNQQQKINTKIIIE